MLLHWIINSIIIFILGEANVALLGAGLIAIWLSRFLACFLLQLVIDVQRISWICSNLPFVALQSFLFAKLRLLLATKSAFPYKL
jgi:hypothetical protein